MLPVVFSDEGIPHALRSILMIPPAFIFAGWGGMTLYRWARQKLAPYPWRRLLPAIALLFLLFLGVNTYWTYFVTWAQNPNTASAFNADYVTIGEQLNALPQNVPKYVIVQAGGVLARGIPMPAQTVMYITNTFTQKAQQEKNIHYVLPENAGNIPAGSYVVTIR